MELYIQKGNFWFLFINWSDKSQNLVNDWCVTSSSSLSLLHGNPYLYLLLQRLYKQGAKDAHSNFTLIVDRPEIILAKINAANLSDVSENITLTFLAFYLTYKNLYLHLNDVPFLFSWSTRKPSTQRRDITSVRRTLLSWLTAGKQQRSSAWYFLWLPLQMFYHKCPVFIFFTLFLLIILCACRNSTRTPGTSQRPQATVWTTSTSHSSVARRAGISPATWASFLYRRHSQNFALCVK